MSDLIDRGDVLGVISCFFKDNYIEDADWHLAELEREINRLDAASPWHRCEDGLPEPHKNVLVTGMEAINNSRVYKVMVNDNGTWRPTDYAPSIRWDNWMHIEPPKEEN